MFSMTSKICEIVVQFTMQHYRMNANEREISYVSFINMHNNLYVF